MKEDIVKNLITLSNIDSTSGDEERVVDYLKKELDFKELEIQRDNLGSIAFIKRSKKKGPSILIAAHMDSPGYLVSKIEKTGHLRINPVGGWWTHVMLAQRITVHTSKGKFTGIIGSKPPHILTPDIRNKVVDFKEIFIDIGAKDKDDAIKNFGVKIGDRAFPKSNAERLNNTDFIVGKGFDDRASVAAGIALMKDLVKQDTYGDIYFVGTTQEEVGLRGAKTAGQKWHTDIAIGLDVTISYDCPGLPNKDVKLNKGASLTVMDRGNIANKKLLEYIKNLANKNNIPFEQDIFLIGGTDTAELQRAHDGTIAMTISIPLRYMHSHNEVISVNDVISVKEILLALVKKMNETEFKKLKFK